MVRDSRIRVAGARDEGHHQRPEFNRRPGRILQSAQERVLRFLCTALRDVPGYRSRPMKPSEEKIRKWDDEFYGEDGRTNYSHAAFRTSIAHKAYAAGRESMREEAAKACKAVANCYGDSSDN